MTKYTAEDFARAKFARHEKGWVAARITPDGQWPWAAKLQGGWDWCSDTDMANDPGWSIVRDAESLTAREHLDAAWEKAHETDAIPAGAGYVTKWDDGDFEAILEGSVHGKPSRGPVFERRLLDPPTPARPDGAEEWEDWLIEALPHESMPDEDIARLADQIAARAARRAEQ